jgi:Ca2+-binding RTX toxin-like protein
MATQITLQAGQTLSVSNGDYVIDASAGSDTIVAGNGIDVVTGGGDNITWATATTAR